LSGYSKEIGANKVEAIGFLGRILTALALHGAGKGMASAFSQMFWNMLCIEMARVNNNMASTIHGM